MAGLGSPRGLPAEPKQISSRLLNMKFMQRAAASDRSKPSSAPSTPSGEHVPKRRRTGDHFSSNHDSATTTPTTTTTPTYKDRFAEPISFSPGSDLPSHNLKSYAGEHYETEWVLDLHLPPTNDHQPQDSNSDTSPSDDDIWSASNPPGVQTYGAFKKNSKTPLISKSARRNATQKRTADDADLSSLSSNSGSDSENSNSSSSSSENAYTTSRHDAARYKTNHKPQTTILGRDHNQLLPDRDTQSDYMKLDSSRGGSSFTHSTPKSNHKGRDKKSPNSKRSRISIGGGEGNGRRNGNDHKDSNRKKKRKTM